MSCQQSHEIELADFLAQPRAEAFAGFRGHYPTCAECSAEVRAWTQLHERLSATHPGVEELAGYASLGALERSALDRHVAGCAACREELSQLAAFRPAALAAFRPAGLAAAAAEPAALAVPASEPAPSERPGRDWLGGLRQLLWHPAFAYAVLALALIPTLYRTVGPGADPGILSDLDAATAYEAPDRSFAARDDFAAAEPPAAAKDRWVKKLEAGRMELEPEPGVEEEILETEEREVVAQVLAKSQGKPKPAPSPPPQLDVESIERDEAFQALAPESSRKASGLPVPRPAERRVVADLRDPQPKLAASRPTAMQSAMAPQDERLGAVVGMADAESAPAFAAEGRARSALRVMAGSGDDAVEVRVGLPSGVEAGSRLEVRIVSNDGRRELLERREVVEAEVGRELTLELPARWLVPGDYRIELRRPGTADPLSSVSLEVRAR